jgi:hypothetical protein
VDTVLRFPIKAPNRRRGGRGGISVPGDRRRRPGCRPRRRGLPDPALGSRSGWRRLLTRVRRSPVRPPAPAALPASGWLSDDSLVSFF